MDSPGTAPLLAFAASALSIDQGSGIDPNGGAMDPNGGSNVGSAIDPDGVRVCYSACVDPNG